MVVMIWLLNISEHQDKNIFPPARFEIENSSKSRILTEVADTGCLQACGN